MDYQLIRGRPNTTTSFLPLPSLNNVFYKAALAETVSRQGRLTGTYDVLLQPPKALNGLLL